MSHSSFIAAALVGCLAGMPPAWAQATPAPSETPAQVLDALAGLPHGLHRLEPADQARLQAILQDPAPYLTELTARYASPAALDLTQPATVRGIWLGAELAWRIPTSGAAAWLESVYLKIDQQFPEDAPTGKPSAALELRTALLGALGDRKRTAVISRLLDRLTQHGPGHRAAALLYLGTAAKKHPATVAKLKTLTAAGGTFAHLAPAKAALNAVK